MTTINDILAGCYTDPAANFGGNDLMRRNFERSTLSEGINEILSQVASNHQGWALFQGMCRMRAKCPPDFTGRNLHPDDIKAVCKRLNVTTLEGLVDLLNALSGVDGTGLASDIYDRPVVLPPLQDITFGDAATRILAATGLDFDSEMFRGQSKIEDSQYELLTEEAAMMLVADFPFWDWSWTAERLDCDDFTRIARGRTSMAGRGNVTAFGADIQAVDAQGNRIETGDSRHSLILILTDQGVWLWETQNGSLHLTRTYYPQLLGGQPGAAGNVVLRLAM